MDILEYVIADICEVMSYLPYGIMAGGFLGLLYLTVCFVRKHELPEIRRWMVSILLIIYSVVLLQIVFFSRESGSRAGMDLRIFGTWGKTLQDHAWVLENLFLFVPFGFLVCVFFGNQRKWHILFAGFMCSVCIEAMQLFTGRGFCQLDDIIMNTAGTLFGILLYIVFTALWRKIRKLLLQRKRRQRIFALLTAAWMLVIYSFSAQPAEESTDTSLRVGRAVCTAVIPGYRQRSEEAQKALAERIEFPVRKGAHMTEYAVLAMLCLGALAGEEMTRRQKMIAFGMTVLYAASDEFHQLFVPGRSGMVRDVLIDSTGAFLGIFVCRGFGYFI